MIHVRYKRFLTVTLMHTFYHDSISQDFTFKPLPDTDARLEAFGLLPRIVNGSLVLYQQHDAGNKPFQEIDTVTDLFFLIRPITDILNITESHGHTKHWFSNLRSDGTYSNVLTQAASVTADDALPEVTRQQRTLSFEPGTIKTVTLKKIVASIGWQTVLETPVDSKATNLKIAVNAPGLYLLELKLSDDTTTARTVVMSDTLGSNIDAWSLLHLQIKQGDSDETYTITLQPRESAWQYYLVESKRRTSPIDPAKMSIKYLTEPTSRYPPNVVINRVLPEDFSDTTKRYVNAIKDQNPNAIREVYLFESTGKLTLFDGEQPQVKILYEEQNLAGRAGIPRRDMKDATIIYKL